ncbi:hypothetical protein D3C72_2548700 [compost metagenome]
MHKATWRELPLMPVDTNYQRFVAAVRGGATLEPSFRRAADIQKVLDAAVASNASGRDQGVV